MSSKIVKNQDAKKTKIFINIEAEALISESGEITLEDGSEITANVEGSTQSLTDVLTEVMNNNPILAEIVIESAMNHIRTLDPVTGLRLMSFLLKNFNN